MIEVAALLNLPSVPSASPGAPPVTEDEALFLDLLRAFRNLRVGDRERFGRELGSWFGASVRQA